jgi:hypothetical protein
MLSPNRFNRFYIATFKGRRDNGSVRGRAKASGGAIGSQSGPGNTCNSRLHSNKGKREVSKTCKNQCTTLLII